MNFAMVNVQSIRNKVEDFLHHVITSNYDVCVLSETWLCENDPVDDCIVAQLKVEGYDFIHSPRKDVNRGGGIGLFFKDNLKVKTLKQRIYSTF